jgi:hypothetical protein
MPTGDYRHTFLLRRLGVAVKVPRLRSFSKGCRCNLWEREMWQQWRPLFHWHSLCPILLADSLGLVVVMPLATPPATQEELDEAYPGEFHLISSEGKPDDYARLNGQLVVVDYGLASGADVKKQRAYLAVELARRSR